MISAKKIIEFWYSDLISKHWFNSTVEIDSLMRENYEALWRMAVQGELNDWRENAESCLALILLFDQFPLNMFRGKVESFSTEANAVQLTLYGIKQEYDAVLPQSQLNFFYMPLMHSELIEHQNLAVEKFAQAGLVDNVRFAKHHRKIIEQFGRFPHRNKIIGRVSSQAEQDYLNSDQAFKG